MNSGKLKAGITAGIAAVFLAGAFIGTMLIPICIAVGAILNKTREDEDKM